MWFAPSKFVAAIFDICISLVPSKFVCFDVFEHTDPLIYICGARLLAYLRSRIKLKGTHSTYQHIHSCIPMV